MAALRGRLPTLLALLATGAGTADVNARFDDGDTPLHMACSAGSAAHVACAAALLDAGAEVDATDEDGLTPLSLAAYEGSKECVQLLLVRGADPLLADADGRTPYDKARQMSHSFVAALLQRHMSLQRGSAGRAAAAGRDDGAGIAPVTAQAGEADAGAAALAAGAS
jgi:cytohesin